MSLDTMFTLEMLLIVVLLVGIASGAVYIWVTGRPSEREPNGSLTKMARRDSGAAPRRPCNHGRFQKDSDWRRARR